MEEYQILDKQSNSLESLCPVKLHVHQRLNLVDLIYLLVQRNDEATEEIGCLFEYDLESTIPLGIGEFWPLSG